MHFKKIGKAFSGGYTFNLAGKAQDKMIELGVPAQVVISLVTKSGEKVSSLVETGQKIKAGQLIGGDEKNPVRSSVYGTVKGFTKLEARGTDAVVIAADSTSGWEPLPGYSPQWRELSAKKLQALLVSAGILDSFSKIEEIIIQGVEDIPYDLSLSVLLAEDKHDSFFEGIRILKSAFPQASLHLAVNENRGNLIERLRQAKDLPWLNLYSLSPKYPQSWPEKLVLAILPQVAFNSENVLILPVAAILDIQAAVVRGKPLLERIISLGGLGWKENFHLRVRVGTPLGAITGAYLQKGNYRLIANNLLVNKAITDLSLPVEANLVSLAAIPERKEHRSLLRSFFKGLGPKAKHGEDTSVHGEIRPCVFCGFCEEACPAGLLPHLLEKYVKRDLIGEELINYGIFACIECNLCTFVCPSKIPVARLIKLGQKKLTEDGYEQMPMSS